MKNFEEYDIDTLLSMPYSDLMRLVYDSIPHHHIEGLPKSMIIDLCGRYPRIFSQLNYLHSLVIERTAPRQRDRWKVLEEGLEDAIKTVKMQYETLSRKYTINKEENTQWEKMT